MMDVLHTNSSPRWGRVPAVIVTTALFVSIVAWQGTGPANATSLRKKPAEDGTTRVRWTSDKLGRVGCEWKPASVCIGPESKLGMTNLVIYYY